MNSRDWCVHPLPQFPHLTARAASRLSGSAKEIVAVVSRQRLSVCVAFLMSAFFVRSCQHVFGVLFQLSFTCMSVHLSRSAHVRRRHKSNMNGYRLSCGWTSPESAGGQPFPSLFMREISGQYRFEIILKGISHAL